MQTNTPTHAADKREEAPLFHTRFGGGRPLDVREVIEATPQRLIYRDGSGDRRTAYKFRPM